MKLVLSDKYEDFVCVVREMFKLEFKDCDCYFNQNRLLCHYIILLSMQSLFSQNVRVDNITQYKL